MRQTSLAVVRLSDVEQVVQAGGAAADAALRAAARERTLHSGRCEGTHFLCDGPNEASADRARRRRSGERRNIRVWIFYEVGLVEI